MLSCLWILFYVLLKTFRLTIESTNLIAHFDSLDTRFLPSKSSTINLVAICLIIHISGPLVFFCLLSLTPTKVCHVFGDTKVEIRVEYVWEVDKGELFVLF